MKTLLVTLSLILAPTLTLAEGGCRGEHTQIEASTCAEGAVWDETKGVCLPSTTS
jgi:hypothetical protein